MGRLIICLLFSIVGSARGFVRSPESCSEHSIPNITRLNFHFYIEILNATNRTLSCEILSDTPLKTVRWNREYPQSNLPPVYNVTNSSCTSPSTNVTCIVSNLTLINVIQGEYEGNYTLTAENDRGPASVFVYVKVRVIPNCHNDYTVPPKLKDIPSVVETVEGYSVSIGATYEGNVDDTELYAYWCITPQHDDSFCVDNATGSDYNVTIKGCQPPCCEFTVVLTIGSPTLRLTGAHLMSAAAWKSSPDSYDPGNSTLVVNVKPTIDTWDPFNDSCTELDEGQSTSFTCIYTASNNSNVTITIWQLNRNLKLLSNSSHYTINTIYGYDHINFIPHVQSTLRLSNAIPDIGGTYVCYCGYNLNAISIYSNSVTFCLKVKKKQYLIIEVIAGAVGGGGIIVSLLIIVILLRKCSKKDNHHNHHDDDEISRLLDDSQPPSNGSAMSGELQTDNKTGDSKPSLVHLPTEEALESEQERPTNPPVSEQEGPRPSMPAPCTVPSPLSSAETLTTEAPDDCRILNSIALDLTANLNMDTLLPYLLSHHLLTSDEEYHLKHTMHSPNEKAQMLSSYLERKGSGSLQQFLCCLNSAHEHTGHKEVADKLKQTMQISGIVCDDFCSDCKQSKNTHTTKATYIANV